MCVCSPTTKVSTKSLEYTTQKNLSCDINNNESSAIEKIFDHILYLSPSSPESFVDKTRKFQFLLFWERKHLSKAMPRTKSKPTRNKQSEEKEKDDDDVIDLVSSSEEEVQEVEKVEMVTTTTKTKSTDMPANTVLLKTLRFKGISKHHSTEGVARILTGPGAGYYRLFLLGDEEVVLCPETLPELNELECFCLGRMTEEKLIYLRIKKDGELNIRICVEGTTNSVYVDPYMTMSRGAFG